MESCNPVVIAGALLEKQVPNEYDSQAVSEAWPSGLRQQSGSQWKSGRAVEGTGLENRQWATIRGFESHLFRQLLNKIIYAVFWF